MIIYLDETLQKKYKKNKMSQKEVDFFNRLAIAYTKNKCFLSGAYETLEFLSQSTIDTKRYYNILKNNCVELKAIVKYVEKVFVITYDNKPKVPDFMKEKCIPFSIDEALNLKIDEGCVFLCENLEDCKLYDLICKKYCLEKGISNINLDILEQSNGCGGSQISIELENKVKNKKFVFAIVDSDKKFIKTDFFKEECKLGSTALTLQRTVKKFKKDYKSLFDYYILEAHEVENLIPYKVLIKLNNQEVDDYLNKFIQNNFQKYLLYYDFKNGFDDYKNSDDSEHKRIYNFWTYINTSIGGTSFPHLCGDLTNKANNLLNDKNDLFYYKYISIDDYLIDIINTIGKKILTWSIVSFYSYV